MYIIYRKEMSSENGYIIERSRWEEMPNVALTFFRKKYCHWSPQNAYNSSIDTPKKVVFRTNIYINNNSNKNKKLLRQ